MKYRKTQDSFHTILKIVFGVVFGVLLLAISYKAVMTSREIRSKAAGSQDITYKSWEFNGTTTEGWMQANLTGFKVANGILTASATNNNAVLFNKSVATTMPVGNKYLKFRLAVLNSPQYSPTSPQSPFTIVVSYMIRGALQQKEMPPIPGTGYGSFYEYNMRLLDIGGITIDSIQIMVKPMRVGTPIQLDWVRLTGPPIATPMPTPNPVTPIPTPKPTGCYTGLQNYTPIKPEACASGYSLGVMYTCWDGHSGGIEGTVCSSIAGWKVTATSFCTGRSNCPTPTSVTTTPIPTSQPPLPVTPTPKPPLPSTTSAPVTPTPTPGPPTVIPYPSPTPTP